MIFDILYIVGLLVIWYGNIHQIIKLHKTRSTKSISIRWLAAIMISFGTRIPRTLISDIWVWKYGYVISVIIFMALLTSAVYYRRRYPKK